MSFGGKGLRAYSECRNPENDRTLVTPLASELLGKMRLDDGSTLTLLINRNGKPYSVRVTTTETERGVELKPESVKELENGDLYEELERRYARFSKHVNRAYGAIRANSHSSRKK